MQKKRTVHVRVYIYICWISFIRVTSIKHRKLQLGGRVEDCLHRAIIHSCVSWRNSTKRPLCPPSTPQRKTFAASVVSTHAKTAQWNRKHRANNFAWALLKVHKTSYLLPLVPPLSSYFHPFALSLRLLFFFSCHSPSLLFGFYDVYRYIYIYVEMYHVANEKIFRNGEDLIKNTCLTSSCRWVRLSLRSAILFG